MIDLSPVVSILGRLIFTLGALMFLPAGLDLAVGNGNAAGFATAAITVTATGAAISLATRGAIRHAFDLRSAFLLTFGIWILTPLVGALPLMTGAPGLGFTDAYFEAVSGITTTGSTVIFGLSDLPEGANLWRGMLNWLGGLGIAFIAMIFLPVMRVGGMQFFKTEGFDTMGKILPRASDIAISLLWIYAGLTALCMLVYRMIGMAPLDAVVHALATIATGGFSPQDASFNVYAGSGEYAGAFFMIVAAVPYVRYVQLASGRGGALWHDPQVRFYLATMATGVMVLTVWRWLTSADPVEPVFRETLFNVASVMTGTGFFSGSYTSWGGFLLVVTFLLGLLGGCSGSSSGALTIFRVQVAISAVRAEMRKIVMPHRVEPVRYAGRTVEDETLNGVMMFVTTYVLLIGMLSVALALTGIDMQTSIFAIWSSMGNIGYGIGPAIAETGTYRDFPTAAKWVMILAMILGRLSLLAVFVVILPRFWRA
ncbi:MAG: TrkH family potassium uptake protein [Gemmobacter sp.]